MGKISPNDLLLGDHIYSYRNLYFYSHHGIYVGAGQVIHFTRTDESRRSFPVEGYCACGFDRTKDHGVVRSCLECFLSGHKLRRVEYGVSSQQVLLRRAGTCYTENSDDAWTVLDRAEQKLRENSFGEYDLIFNNCESFAKYCKTGEAMSQQVVAAVMALSGAGVAVGANMAGHKIFEDSNNEELTQDSRKKEKFWEKMTMKTIITMITTPSPTMMTAKSKTVVLR